MTESAQPFDLITTGRIGVDPHPLPSGMSLSRADTFGIFPPDDFPLHFYRQPKAPDLEIHAEGPAFFAIRATRARWITGVGALARPGVRGPIAARSLPRPAEGGARSAVDTAVGLL
jgi:hypothetical protein